MEAICSHNTRCLVIAVSSTTKTEKKKQKQKRELLIGGIWSRVTGER